MLAVQKGSTATTVPAGHSYSVLTMPTTMHVGQLHAFHQAYETVEHDEALKFSFWDFSRLVGQGHIICGILEDEAGEVQCMFAIELMRLPMPHLSFLYWVGPINAAILSEMMFWCWNALQLLKLGLPKPWEKGAVRVVGRKGWLRVMKRMGIAVDADGYVHEDQEAIRHGLNKRFV